ncbi:hypothetical protein BY996DRAFT_6432492 [Phakopsora pachyrhizi]|uniref:PX domain-containing protein n=1 Tax=Phakopsora pachyrhizi TaxID=170000 RepID=A0AAV0BAG1_PHAPC|nr:hypothetical protein BY996DRAFT_6435896 [Phakopsora pachyrhizi]KAI8450381.1 hypothetical protein BY996DRAFT_6432492 [Phakopsora pachyrhizi]CAH7682702.1 hypothetical protein PPACK8108_LOCUS15778 [Phakopsora pachyrhizi]CAH7683117.1 hypothetical protein PPACK8108_LOCUS16431 [Phakopsora pachyrhizi]
MSPTPKPSGNYRSASQLPPDLNVSEPSALTPLRAHYLKRELVTLQFSTELETLSRPDSLSFLGAPFLPKTSFFNGLPISPSLSPPPTSHKSSTNSYKSFSTASGSTRNRSSQIPTINDLSQGSSDQGIELPFLRFFFHRFVLTFPFLAHAPPSFFSHKLQPFVYSFFSRNISGPEDREEETKRSRIAGKVEKHLGLVMAAAIKLYDNGGEEQVVRIVNESDRNPNEDDAFLSTPVEVKPPKSVGSDGLIQINGSDGFDVNVVAIRTVRVKGRVRTRAHEEFVIRTRTPALGEVYVSRRYREFVQLAEILRVEFPEIDIRNPPPKDRRAVDGTTDGYATANSSGPSPTLPGSLTVDELPISDPLAPIHFAREKNRLTLRAYLHRLLAKSEISNSHQFEKFLISDPIQLTASEKRDVENREARDRAREKERIRFKTEVQNRVRELDQYLRSFREELVKNDGLTRVFSTIREVDKIEKLPIEYRKVIEWARISLASTVYQVFLGSDNSSSSFAQLKRTHGLMPYWAMRGALKISNPVAMIRGILDLFLARPFGTSSLIQRMFTSGLYEEIGELKEDSEKVAAKIGDERMCERVRIYIEAPREIQEVYELDSKSENLDIMTVILRSPSGPKLDSATIQRIHRAAKSYDIYKAYRDNLEDLSMNEGPDNDDAWLFEDLHVYMKLLRRCRDKEQLIELIFEGTTSELLKDIVTIFYSPLMQVYKAANVSDSLADLQKFIDDLIKTVEKAEEVQSRDSQKVVQTFVDLVARHEGAFYEFVHQVHSKGAGLFDGLMHWIELFVNFVRQGLSKKVSLETLLPHPETEERLELMKEIDSIVDYHRKLKIAHHERMVQRLARGGPDENDDQDQDVAFVAGVMRNLNISKIVEEDVGEAANEDAEEDEEEEEEVDSQLPSQINQQQNLKYQKTGQKSRGKSENGKGSKSIEPPDLKIVPTLKPLFTELVKSLLV